jgi:hypothetical protein
VKQAVSYDATDVLEQGCLKRERGEYEEWLKTTMRLAGSVLEPMESAIHCRSGREQAWDLGRKDVVEY